MQEEVTYQQSMSIDEKDNFRLETVWKRDVRRNGQQGRITWRKGEKVMGVSKFVKMKESRERTIDAN